MLLKKKTLHVGLNVFAIFFLVSCASCKDFNWEPYPWVGDSLKSRLVDSKGDEIRADEPRFDEMTCFAPDNIAELAAEIERHSKKAAKEFRKFTKKRNSISK